MSILDHQCTETDGVTFDAICELCDLALKAGVIVAAAMLLYQPLAYLCARVGQ